MENQFCKEKRVGIDFHLDGGIYQGVRTYVANIVEQIPNLEGRLRYVVYVKDPSAFSNGQSKCTNLEIKKLPSPSGRFNLLAGFPMCCLRDSLSLFHSQYVLPAFLGCKSVLTIHDILYESHPEFFPGFHRRLLKMFVPLSARKASRIMADSEYTKGEIVKYYNIPEEKIRVIHLGVSDKLSPVIEQDLIDAALQRYMISKKYILFVGRIEPRKNISGLLRALDYIKKRGAKDLCLVIVGNQDILFKEKELFKNIKKMGLDSDVVFTGGVSEEDLALLYSGAKALVYPSFAEGFGLPVLEAMACGTPVITSNTTSLPEIAGDAALLVDPHSFVGIGESIEAILKNDTLREDLSHRGVKRAQRFRWEETAKKTIQVYREVLLGE